MSQNRLEMAKEMLINAFIKAVTTDIHSVPGRLETIKQLDFIDALRDKLIDEYIDLEQGGAGSEVLGNIVAVLVKIHPDRQEGEPELNLAMVLEKIKERKAQRELEEQSIGTNLASAIQTTTVGYTAKSDASSTDANSLQENFHLGPSMKEVRDGAAKNSKKSGFKLPLSSFLSFRRAKKPISEIAKGTTFEGDMGAILEGKGEQGGYKDTKVVQPSQQSDGRKPR